MKTALGLVALVGRTGLWSLANGIAVGVRVLDAKHSYGVARVCIEPVHGTGAAWVDLGSVVLDQGAP